VSKTNPVLFKLCHGDTITIQWSGGPRLVIADVRQDGTWLRDLTNDESRQLDDAARRAAHLYDDADRSYDLWAFYG
jgi:uncharacterized protein YodC (DUF2158 family)